MDTKTALAFADDEGREATPFEYADSDWKPLNFDSHELFEDEDEPEDDDPDFSSYETLDRINAKFALLGELTDEELEQMLDEEFGEAGV